MTAIYSTPVPSALDPFSPSFGGLSAGPAAGLRATLATIKDPEAIRKALFETAYEPNEKLGADSQAAYVKPENDPLPEGSLKKLKVYLFGTERG